ncbi:RNA polymerase sigma factor [Saccharopolyspora mangrovi]|uniref:RNA polymerase sigma factor n=1 Tax=Saccharopolyspora mangrovi TaxID=3082379 RepID=UPI003899E1BA
MSTPTPPTDIASPRSSASWQLVTAAQAGDRGAFATLYQTYAPGLHRYLQARLRNQAVAEDLASETFLRALRSLHTVTYQGRDVGAWLTTIAANLIRDQLKSARHRNELLDHDTASTQVAHASPESIVPAEVPAAAVLPRLLDRRYRSSHESRCQRGQSPPTPRHPPPRRSLQS